MNATNDRLRLQHMLDAAQEVMTFTAGKTRQDLDQDVLLVRGVCMSIGIIGEAASHITSEYRSAHPEIDWKPIIGMRNFIIHAYFKVDHDILWATITENIPPLIVQLETMLTDNEDEP
jgi:uncharacterized protein with HEPN domain